MSLHQRITLQFNVIIRLLVILIIATPLFCITYKTFATNKVDSLLKVVEKASIEEQINIYYQIAKELTGSDDSLAIQ
jgi:hypothetical protein